LWACGIITNNYGGGALLLNVIQKVMSVKSLTLKRYK
jgi:hypothetical protein